MNRTHMNRNWTILFIGGASGVGKSRIAYELGRIYQVNVIEVDDICQSIKAMTSVRKEHLPAIHFWSTGINWMDIGVNGNVNWLKDVSDEMMPALKAIVENHLESGVPLIIEGDFIHPEFVATFSNPKVKSLFIYEPDQKQIIDNYLSREGGELQHFRAEISIAYGNWLVDTCTRLGIQVVEARPWDTGVDRIIKSLE